MRLPVWVAVILMILIGLLKFDGQLADFANNYFGAKLLFDGVTFDQLYDPYQFNRLVLELGFEGLYLNFMVLPPITALFFTPFLILEPLQAKILFNAISAAFFLLTLFRLLKAQNINFWLGPAFILACFVPIASCLYQGQLYLLLFVFIVEGYLAFQQKKDWKGSVFWGMAACLKIFPILLILLLWREKRWSASFKYIARAVGLVLISCIFVPVDFWLRYVMEVFPRILANEFNDPFSASHQSMSVLLRSLFVYDSHLNPNPWIENFQIFTVLDMLFKLSMLYALWRLLMKTKSSLEGFGLVLLFAIAYNGYSTVYAMVLLLPLMLGLWKRKTPISYLTLVVLVLGFSIPATLVSSVFSGFTLFRMAMFLLALILIFFAFKPKLQTLAFAPIVLFAIVVSFLKPDPNMDAELVGPQSSELLTFDYALGANGITTHFFNENGEHATHLDKEILSIDSTSVQLKDGQLYFNDVAITKGSDRKRKPRLVNESEVYYLSDAGRGVGFFALRKMTWIHGQN